MSFDTKDLSVLAYANGFTLWHYKTGDHNIDQVGYFNPASNLFRAGDMILANLSTSDDRRASLVQIKDVDEGAVIVGRAA
jgi:hypothetical protein